MIRTEIKKSYLAAGGLQENLTNESQTIQGILKAKNNLSVNSISNVGVEPLGADEEIYGHTVSDLQTGVKVENGKISGKLKYVSEGSLPTTWGAGYFLALDFIDDADPTTIKVGLVPSEGSGLVPLAVGDTSGAFKITDKIKQNFVVVKTVDEVEHVQSFDLVGLSFEPAPTE